MDAHKEAGVEPIKELVYTDVEYGANIDAVVEKLVKNKADCIICMDDAICAYVLNRLKVMKISVPDQMKVASFYNSSTLEYNEPAITSLNFDVRELGMESCKTLLQCIKHEPETRKRLLGFEVVLKESTK